jgi:hypothetical protein
MLRDKRLLDLLLEGDATTASDLKQVFVSRLIGQLDRISRRDPERVNQTLLRS